MSRHLAGRKGKIYAVTCHGGTEVGVEVPTYPLHDLVAWWVGGERHTVATLPPGIPSQTDQKSKFLFILPPYFY